MTILAVLLLSGCATLTEMADSSIKINRINEEFLQSLAEDKKSFESLDVAIQKETVPDNLFEGLYDIVYRNAKGDVIKIEQYGSSDDKLLNTSTFYKETDKGSMVITENTPDYYEHYEDYGIPEGYVNYIKKINYYGKPYTHGNMQSHPYATEYYFPGGWSRDIRLLNEEGEAYLYVNELYGPEGELILVVRGDPGHGDMAVETERYENGTLVVKEVYDLEQLVGTFTYYENGEPVNTETHPIDVNGNRTD